jgi:hypothetical protein
MSLPTTRDQITALHHMNITTVFTAMELNGTEAPPPQSLFEDTGKGRIKLADEVVVRVFEFID